METISEPGTQVISTAAELENVISGFGDDLHARLTAIRLLEPSDKAPGWPDGRFGEGERRFEAEIATKVLKKTSSGSASRAGCGVSQCFSWTNKHFGKNGKYCVSSVF